MKNISKKSFKFLTVFIYVSLLLTACNFGKDTSNKTATVTTTPTPSHTQKPAPKELSGIVVYESDDTVNILAGDANIYSFNYSKSSSENLIGCSVTVFYYGTLNDSLSAKTADVENINIYRTINTADENLRRAKEILADMTLEEKVGQMFFVRCPQSDAEKMVSKYHLGGYILFARDFKDKTKDDVAGEIKSYQTASKTNMLVAVDEEGGDVNRVSIYKQFRTVPFWSPQDLYADGGWELIISDAKEKAALLKSLGINVNLAPVCDISTNANDYIYNRSFGKSAALTAIYVNKVVRTMSDNSMGCVLKHFPGYGNNVDTHTGIAYDKRSYETFTQSDFIPFISGMNAGADAILFSHNIVESIDADAPASLSKKTHEILRKNLNFNGVIMTDDLSMDAIKKYTGKKEAAVTAVLSGNDLICCTDFEVQIPAVLAAAKDGTIETSSIDESVLRILCWKLNLGIIE